jgi:hypothetical protein
MRYSIVTVRIFINRTAIFLNIKKQISAVIVNKYLEVKKTKGPNLRKYAIPGVIS